MDERIRILKEQEIEYLSGFWCVLLVTWSLPLRVSLDLADTTCVAIAGTPS